MGGTSPSVPIRSAWRRVARRRRSGQPSSCTCATTTSFHSRPLARWAVEQADGFATNPLLGQGVGGDLLRDEGVEEGLDGRVAALLLGLGGRLEQRADRVEVAVCVARRRSAASDRRLQPCGPGGAAPQLPERLLGRDAGVESGAGVREQAGQGGRLCDARCLLLQPGEYLLVEQCLTKQFGRGSGLAFLGLRLDLVAERGAPGPGPGRRSRRGPPAATGGGRGRAAGRRTRPTAGRRWPG